MKRLLPFARARRRVLSRSARAQAIIRAMLIVDLRFGADLGLAVGLQPVRAGKAVANIARIKTSVVSPLCRVSTCQERTS